MAMPPVHSLKSLADLKVLKPQLLEQAALKQQAAAQLAAQTAARLEAMNLFTHTVGKVIPLKDCNTAYLPAALPAPIATQRALDEQQVMQDCLSDHFGVEQLLETDENLSYRLPGISLETLQQLRKGRWTIQGQLDLHGLRVDAARQALTQFIHHAHAQGWRCIRIVHGKGLGSKDRQPVLKHRVRTWLVQTQAVLGFVTARASEGGAGALVVLLAGG